MKLKKKVSEIYNTPYGQNCVSCEPSKEEIERAVREQNPEKRGFQDDLSELIAEWEKVSRSEYYDHIRQYHARRIAFFVENKWHDPIALNKMNTRSKMVFTALKPRYIQA